MIDWLKTSQGSCPSLLIARSLLAIRSAAWFVRGFLIFCRISAKANHRSAETKSPAGTYLVFSSLSFKVLGVIEDADEEEDEEHCTCNAPASDFSRFLAHIILAASLLFSENWLNLLHCSRNFLFTNLPRTSEKLLNTGTRTRIHSASLAPANIRSLSSSFGKLPGGSPSQAVANNWMYAPLASRVIVLVAGLDNQSFT